LLTRAVVAIRRNRQVYPASIARNLCRLLLIVPLIAVLDLASIGGTLRWVITDKCRIEAETLVGHGT